MPAEPVSMTPLADERAILLLRICLKDEALEMEPSVVVNVGLFASVNVRFAEASNVMSEIVRDRLTVLVVPDPALVNSTESPFAGSALFTQDPAVPQLVLLPAQVKTAAEASPDRLPHTSIAVAAHRYAAVLKVIFMLLTAAFLEGQLLAGKAELRGERSSPGRVYRLGGRTQAFLVAGRGKLTNREKQGTNRPQVAALDVFPRDRLVFQLVFAVWLPGEVPRAEVESARFCGETRDGKAVS